MISTYLDAVKAVDISDDNKLLASADSESVYILNLETREKVNEFKLPPEGKILR